MKKQFYYQSAFREMPDLNQHLIRGILSKPDLNVVKMNTQASLFAMNTKEGVREMTCVMEQIMNEGLKQGMQKGLLKGAKQNQAQVAENMIKDGVLPFEKISLYSGMPVSEIQKIASRLGKN